jgi:RimJ/RimL family protein N-acetyltransferase
MRPSELQARHVISLGPAARAVVAGVRSGELGVLAREAQRRFLSDWRHYGLRRDLEVPFDGPRAKIELSIRELRADDAPKLLDMHAEQMAPRGPYVRMHRLRFLREGIGTCFVAARAEDDEPCYMQWLMGAADNDRIAKYFDGIFPRLAPDEALLEYAFTPERFQGQGIMAAAMTQIAERAATLGASKVITFVDHANVPALKGCHRAGFAEYLVRVDRWRLFRRTPEFEPLPPEFHLPGG